MYDDFEQEEFDDSNLLEEKDLEPKEPKKKKKNRGYPSYVIISLVSALIGGLISPMLFKEDIVENKNATVIQAKQDDINIPTAVAKANMKSVVGITTVELVSDYYFFLPREVEGVGSGVIVDSNGYILTNSHVVGDGKAKSLEVLFEDGEKLPGKVLFADPNLDLAIVKVDKKGLPAVNLGNSDDLQVGEPVVAIGNPLGLDFQRTVTDGIVSGLNRTISVEGVTMTDLIQTNASINKGNSGGPLFNKNGEVIGINTVKVGNAEGLGFSIPINTTKIIIEDVIKKGSYEPVMLGIKSFNVRDFKSAFDVNLSVDKGVIVIETEKNSPAAKANLEQMDIIIKLDNNNIDDIEDLSKVLHKYRDGDKAKLTILRNGEEMEVEVKF